MPYQFEIRKVMPAGHVEHANGYVIFSKIKRLYVVDLKSCSIKSNLIFSEIVNIATKSQEKTVGKIKGLAKKHGFKFQTVSLK